MMVRWSHDEWEEGSHNFIRCVDKDSKTESTGSMPALEEHSLSGEEDKLEYVLESKDK